jgi:hypothetical protein
MGVAQDAPLGIVWGLLIWSRSRIHGPQQPSDIQIERAMSLQTVRRLGVLLGVAVVLGILAGPASAKASKWNGALDRSHPTKLSFSFSGSQITEFTIPVIGCTSATGYQTETILIPSVPVHHGHFSIKYHPPRTPKAVRVKLSGKLAGREVAGTVTGTGLCATGPQPFHANPGKFRPVKKVAPKPSSCTMAGCLASNGMFIRVTMVDRTITSVDDPTNIFNSSADSFLANGGVGVSVVGTDRSAQDPFTFAPVANFQLRLGSGRLVQGDATNSTVVSGSGAQYPCADPTSSQQQLTRGASDGPVNLCYDANNASDRQHLTLYYMPDGFTVLAKIPLG